MARMKFDNTFVTEQNAIIAAEAGMDDFEGFGYDEPEYALAA